MNGKDLLKEKGSHVHNSLGNRRGGKSKALSCSGEPRTASWKRWQLNWVLKDEKLEKKDFQNVWGEM